MTEPVEMARKRLLLARRVFEIIVAVAIIVIGSIAVTGRVLAQQDKVSIKGSCQFWSDLSQIPLTATSSKTVFTIIADARIAYTRQHCAGELPPAPKQVVPYLPHPSSS